VQNEPSASMVRFRPRALAIAGPFLGTSVSWPDSATVQAAMDRNVLDAQVLPSVQLTTALELPGVKQRC
jgi:hypothetical protein